MGAGMMFHAINSCAQTLNLMYFVCACVVRAIYGDLAKVNNTGPYIIYIYIYICVRFPDSQLRPSE